MSEIAVFSFEESSVRTITVGGEGNSKPAFAATALLKKFGNTMTIHAFNKAVEAHGYLEVQERLSTKHKDVVRTFKAISDKGQAYGYNLSNENSKGTTQPLWYQHKFEELLSILGA